MTYSNTNVDGIRRTKAGAGKNNNSPDMSKGGWKCSNPRFQKVANFMRCNNADIDWYERMPTDPPLVNPKVEMPLVLCEEEDVILESTSQTINSQLPHWNAWVCMLEEEEYQNCLPDSISNRLVWKENRILYNLNYIYKLYKYHHTNVKKPPYQIIKSHFMQLRTSAWIPIRLKETCA